MKKCVWLTILTALTLMLGGIGTARAEILPPHGEGQIGLQAVVLCEELLVRQEPSAASKAVKTLRYGDIVIVQRQSDGWAHCFLSDAVDEGPAGWVNADYIAVDPAWYRTDEKTPVYAWNDATAPRVALLDKDTALPILRDDEEWLIVSLRGATGWIHGRNDAAQAAAPAASPEAEAEGSRRDGERFEDTIMLEGMEETVQYEHIVNDTIGIEMDYDYEILERRSESGRERFVSRYDDPEDPQNYLEVSYRPEDADAVSASIGEALSDAYDIIRETRTLDRAGSCVHIDASCVKGTNEMAEFLQAAYIIPAGDGCVVAMTHQRIENSEGFGARLDYILNTLAVIDRQAE